LSVLSFLNKLAWIRFECFLYKPTTLKPRGHRRLTIAERGNRLQQQANDTAANFYAAIALKTTGPAVQLADITSFTPVRHSLRHHAINLFTNGVVGSKSKFLF